MTLALGLCLILGLGLGLSGFGCGEKTKTTHSTETPLADETQPATANPQAAAPLPAPTTANPTPTAPSPHPHATAPNLPKPPVATWVGAALTKVTADGAHFPARRYRQTVPASVLPADFKPSPAVDCYGNFETMGVVLHLPDDVELAAGDFLQCALLAGGRWQPVHNLTQIGATRNYATSIFWLQPKTTYAVMVTLVRPDTPTQRIWFGQGRTRDDSPNEAQFRGSLWVAQDGPVDGDGSQAKPFKTLGQAIAAAQTIPGVHIQVKGGVYYEGDFTIRGSRGAENQGIWISAAAGESVVIDGSNPALISAAVWQADADGLWRHPLEGKCQNVVLEHKTTGALTRLLPIFTVEELRTRTVARRGGFPGSTFAKEAIAGAFVADGETIWLLPPTPLENYTVHVGRGTRAFGLENATNFRLDGVTIRFFGKEDYSCATLVYDSSNILFENCRFLFNDVGIWVKGNSHNITVQHCDFLDGVANFPFLMQKVGGCPLSFEAGVVNVDSKWSGRGLVVRGNHIENQFDGVHLTPWTVNTAVTNEVDFYNNTVLDCVDDFIEADGFARNVRIFDNYMRRSLSGVSLAQALDGPTFVCYNVIADCGKVPATTREGNGGYPFKTNGGDGVEIGSGEIYFYHNTAYTTDPDSRAMWVKRPNWKKITFRNNIWYGKKHGFECWKNPPSPMDFDYDNLFSADPAADLVVLNYKTKFHDLAAVRAKLNWLPHGISADPAILDETTGNYSLQPGSPCIDAGVLVPGINDLRSAGQAPDLGAFEHPAAK